MEWEVEEVLISRERCDERQQCSVARSLSIAPLTFINQKLHDASSLSCCVHGDSTAVIITGIIASSPTMFW